MVITSQRARLKSFLLPRYTWERGILITAGSELLLEVHYHLYLNCMSEKHWQFSNTKCKLPVWADWFICNMSMPYY